MCAKSIWIKVLYIYCIENYLENWYMPYPFLLAVLPICHRAQAYISKMEEMLNHEGQAYRGGNELASKCW